MWSMGYTAVLIQNVHLNAMSEVWITGVGLRSAAGNHLADFGVALAGSWLCPCALAITLACGNFILAVYSFTYRV